MDTRHHLGADEGVPPQGEEVVVDADALGPQQIGPDARQ